MADLRPAFDEAARTLGRLAAAAHVAAPGLSVTVKSRRLGMVERRRDGLWIVMQPVVLTAPERVVRGLLAHEVAHIARRHPAVRWRLKLAAIASIWLVCFAFIGVLILQIATGNTWLWLIEGAVWLIAALTPRAIQLALFRRQEYEADRVAVELLGTSEPVIALFDWISANTRQVRKPLVVRLWMATHPSTAARRQALAGSARDGLAAHSSKGR